MTTMRPQMCDEKLDLKKTAAKLRRAMDRLQEIDDDIVKHKFEFDGGDYTLLGMPFGRVMLELSEIHGKLERLANEEERSR